MKLCLIAPTPPPYGGVANWEQIIESEIKKDKDVEVSLIDISANKRPLDGRNFFDRYVYSGYVMLRAYFKLLSRAKKDRPDVVHITTSGGMGFYRDLLLLQFLKKKGIPSVYHLHFGRTVQYKEEGGRCWKQLLKSAKLANRTIAIDNKTFRLLKEEGIKVVEINNPIAVREFDRFLCQSEKKIITYVGWIIKPKGVEELIQAFNRFAEGKGRDYELFLIGPGDREYIEKLKAMACDKVVFLGERPHEETMEILAESCGLILPSYTEGFPNVILEAMALRKYVVGTKVGAIPEMLSDDAGVLIEAKNVEDIWRALEKLTDEAERKRIASKGYEKVLKNYDVEVTMAKYRDVWSMKEEF